MQRIDLRKKLLTLCLSVKIVCQIACLATLLSLSSCNQIPPPAVKSTDTFLSFLLNGRLITDAFLSNGHLIVLDIYRPNASNGLGLLMLHGSSPRGRKLHLHAEIAAQLGLKGYTIVNLDQRGYRESEDPQHPDKLEDYDFVGDSKRALDWIHREEKASTLQRFMVGHSKGGGVAVRAGMEHENVQGVISISPGRRIQERFFQPPRPDLQYLQERKSCDMKLDPPIPLELLEPILSAYDIGQWRGQRILKPLFVIERGNEPKEDLTYTRELVT